MAPSEGWAQSLVEDRPSLPSPGVLDPGPGKASSQVASTRCLLLWGGAVGGQGGWARPGLAQRAVQLHGGPREGRAWPSSGPAASRSRIQSNYMALQRINQELEDKLYRMVRAAPKPTAPPQALWPWTPALVGPCCPPLAHAGAGSQAFVPGAHCPHPAPTGQGRPHPRRTERAPSKCE